MANNNRNNQKKQPKRYTGKNVDNLGDPLRMERHAMDIFRDMSRARYNINNLYEFQNPDFVFACIRVAQQQVRQNQIICNALVYSYPESDDGDVLALNARFTMLLNGWTKVQNTMIMYQNTQDLGSLIGLVQILSNSRDLRL